MGRAPTDDEKREIRQLYGALAKHYGWPMPQTWLEDRRTILNDLDNALVCLRNLVTYLP